MLELGLKAIVVVGLMTTIPVKAQLYTFNGDSDGDRFGESVSGAGDVNADGIIDLVVGAPGTVFNTGSSRVFSGQDGSILYTFYGDAAGSRFGNSVSDAGDVDADGFGDIIVGAPGIQQGSAKVFSGQDGSILYTFYGDSLGDQFGYSVSGAGDVNGDGFSDLIVGAIADSNNGFRSGSARVFSGQDGSILYTFNGDSRDDFFGRSVSGAGDVNGDGFVDLIVGAAQDDNNGSFSGSARVFSGQDGSILYTFNGDSAQEWLGWSVSGAGDVNADGFADLIVGAFNDVNNGLISGSARVFSGQDGSLLYIFYGDLENEQFGWSVSGADDVNGDGFADFIVGARFDDNNGYRSGSARVFSGQDGSILYIYNGEATEDVLGKAVSGVGDINGDGFADLIIGAPSEESNKDRPGSVLVFTGGPNPVAQIENLILAVAELNLQQGIENSLDAKLDSALNALDDVSENNDQAACNSLGAFINAVEAQRGNKISDADADVLIEKATAIINLICPQ